ncbi:MAG: hypothetical protein JO036_02715 [Candidatus Eremiobacteraeota bacterium]|nr:hypothetical protein [Candidatus Eremiobacteraeota bacterium]
MHQLSRLMLAAAAMALAAPSAAFAQTTQPSPMPVSTGTTSSPAPASSALPAPAPTTMSEPTNAPASSAPATSAPKTGTSGGSSGNGNAKSPAPGQYKKIKSGTLTRSQVLYGLTHQVAAAKQLLKMKTVNFNNLRVYKLPTSLKTMFKVSDADTQALALALLGNGVQVAQTTPSLPSTNGNNSPIQYLRDVLANINVSNALNNLNVLNNSNVNLNVALSNVLNNNKISIGQVVGLYIGGGGIITTITK